MYSLSKANKLLPKIIDKNNQFKRQIKNKFKASEIFYEFEKKASNELMNMVKLSDNRNRDIKTGALLHTVLSKSNDKSNELSSKIVNDPLFININTFKDEKKKLKKNITKEYEEELANIIKQMESTGKVDYHIERKKTHSSVEESKNTYDILSKDEKKERIDNIISTQFLTERDKFNNSLKNYLSQMNNLYSRYYDDNEKAKELRQSKNFKSEFLYIKKKIPVATYAKLGMLNYTKPIVNDNQMNKSTSAKDIFNIKKMLPFTKLGIQAKNNNDHKSERKKSEATSRSTQMAKVFDLLNSGDNDNISYGNTAEIVLKQAVKNYAIDDTFLTKAQMINYLVDRQLPSLADYDKIVKTKITQMKLNRKTKMLLEPTTTGGNTSDNTSDLPSKNIEDPNQNTFTKIKSSKIKEEIKALIDGAKKQNRSETVEVDNKNKKGNSKAESFTFLGSVPERCINNFCDGYSMRDGSCNQILKNLVGFFGKKSFSKREISERINAYMELMNHQAEKKKNKIHQLYLEKINNEEKKLIAEKIKRNLNSTKETNEDDVDCSLHKNKSCADILYKGKRMSEISSDISSHKGRYDYNDSMSDINKSGTYEEFLEQKKLVENKYRGIKEYNDNSRIINK